jgi:hypothetical protein
VADAPDEAVASRRSNPSGDPTGALPGTGAADDTALLGAYALGALTPDERAAVEERLAASPALQDELRRLIPVAALLREATATPPIAADRGPSADDGRDAPVSLETTGPEPVTTAMTAGPVVADASPPRTALVVSPPPGVAVGGVLASSEATAARRSPEPAVPVQHSPAPPNSGNDEDSGEETRADETHGAEVADNDGDETASVVRVEAAPGSLSSRPPRRQARATGAPARAELRSTRVSAVIGSWPPSWIAAGLATLIAVGALLWALSLVDRLDTRRAEVDGLRAELRELQAGGDAASVPLAPVEGGPADADGVAVVVPSEGSLIVRVSGLPASAEGRVYQVWFQAASEVPEGGWIVGPVFRVGEGGAALVELPAAVPDFARLAVSDEPAPGGDAPTGPFLLEGVPPTSP